MNVLEEGKQQKHTCLSCGMEYEGNYCPNCGQSKRVGRLSLKRVLTESLPDIYNLDNRFMRTCVDLFRRPGEMIMDYINGDRVRYYKPISLLFVMASILIIVSQLCNIETTHEFDPSIYVINGNIRWCEDGSTLDKIIRTIYYLYWNEAWSTIISITLLVWPMKWAFRKTEVGKRLNLAEFFFIMLYLNCQSFIIKVLQIPLNFIFSHWALTSGLFDDGNVDLVCTILWLWALMQIFGTGKRRTLWNYIKANIIMYIVGFIIATIITIIVSVGLTLIDPQGNPFTRLSNISFDNDTIAVKVDSITQGIDSISINVGEKKKTFDLDELLMRLEEQADSLSRAHDGQ